MKTLPARARRAPLLAAALALLAASPRAHAWDPDTHASIVRLALAISPAADARIKDSFESFYDAVRAPDPFDKKCKDHPTAQAPRDAATMAGQALEQLLAGKMLASPAARAHAIGRIVHYVADAAVPEAMLQDSNPLDPFWGETTYTIFRESRPLTRPYAESIRSIGALTRWGTDGRSMRAYAFRVAVNLVADTLLAIPAEGAAPSDVGPVIFAIDRTDPGPPPAVVQQSLASKVKDIKAKAAARNAPPAERNAESGGPPTDTPGLHLVEWVTRAAGDGVDVRALLYNNDDKCAEKISIGSKSVSIDIPGKVAPRSLKTLELHTAATPGQTLRAMAKEAACAAPYPAGSGTPVKERILLNAASGPLRLDRTLPEPELAK